ncbi:carbohydrate-binding domain-containing protein [Labilibaculum sp. DW002]|uniref:Carbohydrate-binding domain-containing protein n=1 Tax=Paralabilibaculum antarcticum TaxID=2912572 RepID=A0ABT5VXT9_9BACT|nr:carbohydrate-binding domain-containing protein [Labilibaculum sp. DW002]MDE5420228.1 carbohydrate-binding domain-containing protein [Labilibaculum sp. DW002]
MTKKNKLSLLFTLLLSLSLFSCERDTDSEEYEEESETISEETDNVESHESTEDYSWDSTTEISVVLNDNSIVSNADGISTNGSTLTIKAAGNYNISGSLSDGQIIVDTEDEDIVRLILNGVDINCTYNSPIFIRSAEKTMIVLEKGMQNYLSDGNVYTYEEEDDDSNACIYSKDDMTIYGEGSLLVKGNFNDGITSKDGLIIDSELITINAVDDGIRGKDYLIIKNGDFLISCGGDGLKSDEEEDDAKGYISITNGNFEITSDGDAITAETDVLISYAEMDLIAGGGSASNTYSSTSTKGIKAGSQIIIESGVFSISSADDAIHSNGIITLNDGVFEIASGDDGIHADADLDIIDSYINISESYEGLESAEGNINIYDGDIFTISSDDGINISAGGGSSGPGTKSTGTYALNIYGGYIVVDSNGDGLDSNDAIVMSGGIVIVSSSATNENSALDYDGSCIISGGLLVGSGTSRMDEAPSTASTQYAAKITFNSTQPAGQMVHIESADGDQILTIKPKKAFQSFVVSSPDLKNGVSYNIYLGGNSNGSKTNGLYTGGTYSDGSLYSSFTISSKVSLID